MNKQERLHSVKRMNVRWMLLQLAFALPTGLLVYYFLQPSGSPILMAEFLLLLTSAASVLFMREARFVKALTTHDQAKKVIGIQYQLDYMMVIFIYLFFPLLLKLETISWVLFFIFALTALALVIVDRLLDEKVKLIDHQQQTRRYVKRESF